jgi:hypothetical protein
MRKRFSCGCDQCGRFQALLWRLMGLQLCEDCYHELHRELGVAG